MLFSKNSCDKKIIASEGNLSARDKSEKIIIFKERWIPATGTKFLCRNKIDIESMCRKWYGLIVIKIQDTFPVDIEGYKVEEEM